MRTWTIGLAAVIFVVAAGCGGNDGSAATAAPSTSSAPPTTAAPDTSRCGGSARAAASKVVAALTSVTSGGVSMSSPEAMALDLQREAAEARSEIADARGQCADAMPSCPTASNAFFDALGADVDLLENMASTLRTGTSLNSPTPEGIPAITCNGVTVTGAVDPPPATTTTTIADPSDRVRALLTYIGPDRTKEKEALDRLNAAEVLLIDDPSQISYVHLAAKDLLDMYATAAFAWNEKAGEPDAIGEPYRTPLLELKRGNEMRVDAFKELVSCSCSFTRVMELTTSGLDESTSGLLKLKAVLK